MTVAKFNGVPIANIAKINGVALASIKSLNGVELAATGVPAAPTDLVGHVRKVSVLPGEATAYFSTGPVIPSGDFSVVIDMTFDVWPPTNTAWLFQCYNTTGNQRCWNVGITTAGEMQFRVSTNGTNNESNNATIPSISSNQRVLLRNDWEASTGRKRYYISYNGGATWSNYYNTVTGFSGNPFNSNAPTWIGQSSHTATDHSWPGTVHRAQVYNNRSLDPSGLLADFNPSYSAGYGTGRSWTAETGEVWTGQGNAGVSAINNLVIDSFTDADGTLLTAHDPDLGGPWIFGTSVVDTMSIQSNRAQKTDFANGFAQYYENSSGSPDCEASVDWEWQTDDGSTARNDLQLFVRAIGTDSTDWYRLLVNKDGAANEKNSIQERIANGAIATRAEETRAKPANGTVLRYTLKADGSAITAWTSDGLSLSYGSADPALDNASGLAIGANVISSPPALAWMDNYKVTTISDTPE